MSSYNTSLLSVEQAKRMLRAAQGHPLEALWAVALVTGMRRGELLALCWQEVNFETGWMSLHRELGGLSFEVLTLKQPERRRDIPLSPQLIGQLQQHRQRQQELRAQAGTAWSEQDLVFCDERGDFLRHFDLFNALHELLVKAHLSEVIFHELRASTTRMLLLAGIHSLVIEKLLGHSAMYTSPEPIAPALLQEAVNMLSIQLLSVDDGLLAFIATEKGGAPS